MTTHWVTQQALADLVGEDWAARVFRNTYHHSDHDGTPAIEYDRVLDLLRLNQLEGYHDDL